MPASRAQTIMQINKSWAVFSLAASLAAAPTPRRASLEAGVAASLAVMAAPAIANTPVARHKS